MKPLILTKLFISLALVIAIFAIYYQALGHQFITHFDDNDYVAKNDHVLSGLNARNLQWAFTAVGYSGNWHPVTWISHMIDGQVFGSKPMGHHLTNIALHALNAVLLFLILSAMTGSMWRSAFVAALFAVHPLQVQSVAWVAERKNLLSTLFMLLTLFAYFSYVRKPNVWRYLGVAALFAIGLMSKPMLVTLPLLLLVFDFWPLGRMEQKGRSWTKLVMEKLPLLGLSAASAVMTVIAQHAAQAIMPTETMSIATRLSNAAVSYVAYIVKCLWPARLSVFYPIAPNPVWMTVGCLVAMVAITVLAFRLRRPYLAAGWFWYLISLIPVIGIVQVGSQAMADRYCYVPLIGVFAMLAWGIPDLVKGKAQPAPKAKKTVAEKPNWTLAAVAVGVILALTVAAWNETHYWRDGEALFGRAFAVTQESAMVHLTLGMFIGDRGDGPSAIEHFEAAIRLDPQLWRTYNSLGTAYARDGKLSEAIAEYRKALDIADDPMTRFNLASALSMSGQIKEAETHYQAAIKAKPDCVDYRNGYGMYLLTTGAADRALAQFKEAAALWPGSGETHANIGLALAQMGRTDEAMQSFNRSLEIDPNAMKTHYQVAGVLAGTGNLAGAIEHYERAHELSPENPVICNVLAWFRATAKDPSLRDGKQAVLLAETACAATAWKDPQTVDTLAAAYAECGQFDQAVTTARRALTVARKLGQSDVATRIDSRLKLYSSHKAYHEGM